MDTTVKNSRGCMLVESLPLSPNNYDPSIKAMKEQCGREDLLVEFYIRELLKLVLNRGGLKLADLYDRLETQLCALETLNILSDSYAAIMFPLIESCFPIETLNMCQHSNNNRSTSMKERVGSLMGSLKSQVDREERVEFSCSRTPNEDRSDNSQLFSPVQSYKHSILDDLIYVSSVRQQCVFCNEHHLPSECLKSQNMTLDEKKVLLAKSRYCFSGTKTNHPGSKCRSKCSLCSGGHIKLMFNQPGASKPVLYNNIVSVSDCSKVNHSLTLRTGNEVYLQTFAAVLYTDKMERKVRVLVDSGSQRSYVRSALVEEMGYQSLGKESLVHTLFGGRNAGLIHHSQFKIHLHSTAGEYACNLTALDQGMIAASIPTADLSTYVKQELEKCHIKLTEDLASPIDVLIGADVAGKIWCGPRVILSSGLVAVKTLFGWTIMGTVGPTTRRNNLTTQTLQRCTL